MCLFPMPRSAAFMLFGGPALRSFVSVYDKANDLFGFYGAQKNSYE